MSGAASGTVSWTKEGSPYLVPNGFIVPTSTSLSIGPGVIVAQGRDSLFDVWGELDASGTPEEPVLFTSLSDPAAMVEATASPFGLSFENGGGRVSYSPASSTVYYAYVTDAQGGRSGSGYSDKGSFDLGDPPVPFGSNLEAVVAPQQIDGSCPTPRYSGSIDADFACALAFAARNAVPVSRISSSTPPDQGSWQYPLHYSQGSSGRISHSIFRFGGLHSCDTGCVERPLLDVEKASVEVSDSTFEKSMSSDIALGDGGDLSVERSVFRSSMQGVRIESGRATVRDSDFDGLDAGVYVADAARATADATQDWWGDPRGPQSPDNLAGVGSVAYLGAAFVPWATGRLDVGATATRAFVAPAPSPSPLTPVVVIPGILGSFQYRGSWVIDPVLHAYDSLFDAFRSNGYSSTSLFAFPYDWRLSAEASSRLLKSKIDEIKSSCRCSKVDMVAHSFGGLVARAYIESPEYGNDVRKIAFVATPHLGAPEAYLAYEAGEFGPSFWDRILGVVFSAYSKWQGYASTFDYIRSFPVSSVRELLPVRDYLIDQSGPLRAYPDRYPANPFLESLASDAALVAGRGIDAENFVGDVASSTIESIVVGKADASTTEWRDGREEAVELGLGDGTVPLASSALSSSTSLTYHASHIDLVGTARGDVLRFISGLTPTSTPSRGMPASFLFVIVHSPADVMVEAANGARVGRDPDSHEELRGIPGAFHSGIGTDQLVSIPDPDGRYTISVEGRSAGSYGIEADLVSQAEIASSSYSATVSEGSLDRLVLDVGSGSVSPIKPESIESEGRLDAARSNAVPAAHQGAPRHSSGYDREATIEPAEQPIDFSARDGSRPPPIQNKIDSVALAEDFVDFNASSSPVRPNTRGLIDRITAALGAVLLYFTH